MLILAKLWDAFNFLLTILMIGGISGGRRCLLCSFRTASFARLSKKCSQ